MDNNEEIDPLNADLVPERTGQASLAGDAGSDMVETVLYEAEWYPVIEIQETCDWGTIASVPKETLKRWEGVLNAFDKMQTEMRTFLGPNVKAQTRAEDGP